MGGQEMKNAIGDVLTSIVSRSNERLFALSQEELAAQWYFEWNSDCSLEWNIYDFSKLLEMYKNRCRRWEEHHNGSCCVVERVRDTYLMPRIKAFAQDLESHFTKPQEQPK